MAKEKKIEYKMADFCNFVINKWLILLCCLAIGAGASVYSWKHQNALYSSEMTMLFHDKVDTAGDNDEYSQLSTIVSSKDVYEKHGVKTEGISFGDLTITNVGTGVIKVVASGTTEENVNKNLDFVKNNSEKVINDVFRANQFEMTVVKSSEEASVKGTKKDKILSVSVIMGVAVLVALGIDFFKFVKLAKQN